MTGRKAYVTINLLNDPQLLLSAEVERLRRELSHAWALLESERKKCTELENVLEVAVAVGVIRSGPSVGFEDDEELNEAFDAFISQPDPHLDRVRSFLVG